MSIATQVREVSSLTLLVPQAEADNQWLGAVLATVIRPATSRQARFLCCS